MHELLTLIKVVVPLEDKNLGSTLGVGSKAYGAPMSTKIVFSELALGGALNVVLKAYDFHTDEDSFSGLEGALSV